MHGPDETEEEETPTEQSNEPEREVAVNPDE